MKTTLLHTRVYHPPTHKMYNFVYGYEAGYFKVIDVQSPDPIKIFHEIEVIKCKWIGVHDNTLWTDLSSMEKDFWAKKGYTEKTWIGKEIYESDVVRVESEGTTRMEEIKKLGAQVVGIGDDKTVHELPYFSNKEKRYVVGNSLENPSLIP